MGARGRAEDGSNGHNFFWGDKGVPQLNAVMCIHGCNNHHELYSKRGTCIRVNRISTVEEVMVKK